MTRYHAEYAWLGPPADGDGGEAGSAGMAERVLIEVDGDRIGTVTAGVPRPPGAVRLPGVTLPGFADAHSHAFHRALRGRTQRGTGTFWTWREEMYRVADRLTPDSCLALARAAYAEMALAGISCVGEFHYLHHGPDGTPYPEPNVMGEALIAAAEQAGIRITLLDACYLTGGPGRPLAGPQRRFGDGTAEAWAARVDALAGSRRGSRTVRVGAAIHSVRAVPPAAVGLVAEWAAARRAPLHVHLSEQRAENEASLAAYGRTPTALLAERGALGPRSTVVHATHLGEPEIAALGASGATVCLAPTTERDLADGIGRPRDLAAAGCPLSLGSDSNAVVDPLEEARALELGERLRTGRRGHWRADDLLSAATSAGHACLGWPDAGRIAPGRLADLTTLRLDSVRLAGARPPTLAEAVVFAGSAADVWQVVVGGRVVVAGGRHRLLDDVPGLLDRAVTAVTGPEPAPAGTG